MPSQTPLSRLLLPKRSIARRFRPRHRPSRVVHPRSIARMFLGGHRPSRLLPPKRSIRPIYPADLSHGGSFGDSVKVSIPQRRCRRYLPIKLFGLGFGNDQSRDTKRRIWIYFAATAMAFTKIRVQQQHGRLLCIGSTKTGGLGYRQDPPLRIIVLSTMNASVPSSS